MSKQIQIYIGADKLDLFEDENIVINSSIKNINDISKVFTDFSQTFTVPASQNNNKIFKHYYNADIDNGFDARVKKNGRIEINYLPFKEGKIRLEGAQLKDNKPVNYKITFFGNLTNLTDLFGDDYLNDLDFSAYNHNYNYLTVATATHSNFIGGGAVIYPLISPVKKWFYNSSTSDHTNLTDLVNIAYHAGDASSYHGILWTELKPALLISKIIDAIETKYNIVFSNDFFGSGVLTRLYLWLSKGKGYLVPATETQILDVKTHVSGSNLFNLSTNTYTTNLVSKTGDPANGTQRVRGHVIITPKSGFETTKYALYKKTTSGGSLELMFNNLTGTRQINYITRILENGTFNSQHSFYINAEGVFQFNLTIYIQKQQYNGSSWSNLVVETVSGSNLSTLSQLAINTVVPELKVKDFFKSLITMYNLAIIPTAENEFYINTLDEWYNDGETYDISKYISTDEYHTSRTDTFNQIEFKFKENDSILINEFKKNNNYYYGDANVELKDTSGETLEGKALKMEVSFENMVYERLTNENTGLQTNVMYGLATDDDLDPTNLKNHIFYAIDNNISSTPISFVENSSSRAQLTSAWIPCHENSLTSPTYSTVFNSETNEYTLTTIQNSLYTKFYSKYIGDNLSEKRRLYKYEAKLPEYLLTKIKLNDKLIIQGRKYLINNMEINLTNNITKLELLNDII